MIAVDPRWLLSSLKLHYAELFGTQKDEEAWQSTPLHYLEKIIQVPFALRPMGGGVESLVHGHVPSWPRRCRKAKSRRRPRTGRVRARCSDQTAQEVTSVASASPVPFEPRPGLSPRTLALTDAERECAVTVARAAFDTPRTVKKFTNLYRLLRAGLDDDELDVFLVADGDDIPEYQAVMILLAVVIAFPEEASTFLTGLGDLDPDGARVDGAASAYFETFEGDLGACLQRVEPPDPATREPFRRWALEVSRYSFATGQEVFAEFRPRLRRTGRTPFTGRYARSHFSYTLGHRRSEISFVRKIVS